MCLFCVYLQYIFLKLFNVFYLMFPHGFRHFATPSLDRKLIWLARVNFRFSNVCFQILDCPSKPVIADIKLPIKQIFQHFLKCCVMLSQRAATIESE